MINPYPSPLFPERGNSASVANSKSLDSSNVTKNKGGKNKRIKRKRVSAADMGLTDRDKIRKLIQLHLARCGDDLAACELRAEALLGYTFPLTRN